MRSSLWRFDKVTMLDKAYLQLFTALIHNAIAEHNEKAARETMNWIDSFSPIFDDYYSYTFHNAVIDYIGGRGAAGTRIKKLPKSLEIMSPFSESYKKISKVHKEWASQHNIKNIEMLGKLNAPEYPEFLW